MAGTAAGGWPFTITCHGCWTTLATFIIASPFLDSGAAACGGCVFPAAFLHFNRHISRYFSGRGGTSAISAGPSFSIGQFGPRSAWTGIVAPTWRLAMAAGTHKLSKTLGSTVDSFHSISVRGHFILFIFHSFSTIYSFSPLHLPSFIPVHFISCGLVHFIFCFTTIVAVNISFTLCDITIVFSACTFCLRNKLRVVAYFLLSISVLPSAGCFTARVELIQLQFGWRFSWLDPQDAGLSGSSDGYVRRTTPGCLRRWTLPGVDGLTTGGGLGHSRGKYPAPRL